MRRWWLAALVMALALALVAQGVVATDAHAKSDDAGVCSAGASECTAKPRAVAQSNVPEFVPTEEWQEILPGQSIPPGLHVRMNLETGKKEAKLITDDDDESEAVDPNVIQRDVAIDVSSKSEASVTVTTDISGEVQGESSDDLTHAVAVVASETEEDETLEVVESLDADAASADDEAPPAKEPEWNHEKIYEVLQALPEPPTIEGMDIHDAHAKLSQPEFRRHMIKLWKKRQQDLKEAIDSMQDDAKYLAKLLDQLEAAEKAGDTDGQLNVLEVLEWEVQDLDKTHVFNFIGGFGVITDKLNSTNLPVRAHASWLIGTACKNYKDGQNWAINAGAIPKLVDSLSMSSTGAKAAEVQEVKKKAIYALASLVRFNERGQRLLLSQHGLDRLGDLLSDTATSVSVKLKAVLFAHDLLAEEAPETPVDVDAAALHQLQEILRSSQWCEHTSSFLTRHAKSLQRSQIREVLQAMTAQLPSCRQVFEAASVKTTVSELQSAWSQANDVEEEEQTELSDVVSRLRSLL
ncbi:hypothetical protein ATCC90586_001076 [Pythium insidiosum]|nr:hypothetical protein ATCC90586_001076 [Pythium insidiosum]